jgi:hypothetical protein
MPCPWTSHFGSATSEAIDGQLRLGPGRIPGHRELGAADPGHIHRRHRRHRHRALRRSGLPHAHGDRGYDRRAQVGEVGPPSIVRPWRQKNSFSRLSHRTSNRAILHGRALPDLPLAKELGRRFMAAKARPGSGRGSSSPPFYHVIQRNAPRSHAMMPRAIAA